jgi:hypothetical protein
VRGEVVTEGPKAALGETGCPVGVLARTSTLDQVEPSRKDLFGPAAGVADHEAVHGVGDGG